MGDCPVEKLIPHPGVQGMQPFGRETPETHVTHSTRDYFGRVRVEARGKDRLVAAGDFGDEKRRLFLPAVDHQCVFGITSQREQMCPVPTEGEGHDAFLLDSSQICQQGSTSMQASDIKAQRLAQNYEQRMR
eukprot:1319866-Rhodomonas_salina.2